jgi:hypothetical protein
MSGLALRTALIGMTAAAALLAAPNASLAQAWLPPKGEASFAMAYQYQRAPWHTTSTGERLDRGLMEWNYVVADLGYSVSDRFAVRVALPFVLSKYTGTFPHKVNGSVVRSDDGKMHGTFQDFRFEARFMATSGSLVVTPFVSGGLPSADYATMGHASPGRGLWEVGAGVNLGRRLDPFLPEAYVQGRFSFTIPETVIGISHDRSNASLDMGYFLTSALTLRASVAGQVTHGGLRNPRDVNKPEYFLYHDRLMRENYVGVGAGASYALTGSTDVFVSGFKQLSGRNGILTSTVAFGIVQNFSPAQIIRKMRRSPPEAPTEP